MKIRAEDSIGYWLFFTQRTVSYAFSEVLRRCCQENGKPYVVTPPQYGVLALFQDGDAFTIGSIGQMRRIDAPTVTGIIKRLEQGGLVERWHDRVDRRVVNVHITAEGRAIMRLLAGAVDSFNETMTQGISAAEQRALLDRFQQIVVNLARVAPGSGDRFGILPHTFVWEAEA